MPAVKRRTAGNKNSYSYQQHTELLQRGPCASGHSDPWAAELKALSRQYNAEGIVALWDCCWRTECTSTHWHSASQSLLVEGLHCWGVGEQLCEQGACKAVRTVTLPSVDQSYGPDPAIASMLVNCCACPGPYQRLWDSV